MTTTSFELSDYDKARLPHAKRTHGNVSRPWNFLSSQMKCPVCLNIIKDTMTTHCMHRFCAECIKKCLRASKKECPTCRMSCPSKRSLRRDKDFDALIDAVYPNRQVIEKYQEELMAMLTASTNLHAHSKAVQDGMQAQAISRKQRVEKANSEIVQQHHLSRRASAIESNYTKPSNTIEVILKPLPRNHSLPHLSQPFLVVPANAPVTALLYFLVDSFSEFYEDLNHTAIALNISSRSGLQAVNHRRLLKSIAKEYFTSYPDQPFTIYYCLKGSLDPPSS